MFRTVSAWQMVVAVTLCMTVHGDAVTSAAQDYGSGLGIWSANPVANDPVSRLNGDGDSAMSAEVSASGYGFSYGDTAGVLDRGASYSNVFGSETAPTPQYGQKSGSDLSAPMAYPGSGIPAVSVFPNPPAAFPGDVSSLLEYPSHALSLSQGVATGAPTSPSPSEAQAKANPDYANPVFPSASDPGREDSPVTIVPEPATLALVGIALAGWISSKLRHRLIRT